MRLLYLLIFIFLGTGAPLCAQLYKPFNQFSYDLEAGAAFATETQTPFWLRSNQYGMVPQTNPFVTLRVNPHRDYRTDSTRRSAFDWAAGAFFVVNRTFGDAQGGTTLLWPEVYAKLKWKQIELSAGRQREVIGLGDSTLSSGFYAWSGNAMPFPKIQLQTHGFISLGFLKHILAFQGAYAHGWFTASYINQAYFHQKQFYVRFGKPHWPLRLYAGMNHQVQWGGHADYLNNSPAAVNGALPNTFQDYLSLITGRYPDDYANDRFNSFDGANRIGNHLGSYDLGIELKTTKFQVLLYHQHPYEDASGLAWQNRPDGLTGLRWLRKSLSTHPLFLKHIVLEYLTTTNQSGEQYSTTSKYQGADNYFNHGQYLEGWSYNGFTLGTPFIAPRATIQPNNSVLTPGYFFPNNRLRVGYIGTEWQYKQQLTVRSRFSYSQNLGAYGWVNPRTFYQFSGLVSAQIRLNRWSKTSIKGSLAYDQGELFLPSFGGYFGICKSW